jgi:segregation and condensation protein B
VLATLLERNLVTIRGRSKVVGRPLLYGTTPEFLDYFGLKDLAELPRPEELRALVAAREPEQLEMSELEVMADAATGLAGGAAPASAAKTPASDDEEEDDEDFDDDELDDDDSDEDDSDEDDDFEDEESDPDGGEDDGEGSNGPAGDARGGADRDALEPARERS